MPSNRETRRSCLLSALLAAAILLAFFPVLNNDFIKFDDGFYIVHNPHVTTGLTWNNLRWSLGAGYQGNWHPVTWISHMLDVQLFGLRPGWHHLMNLLLHTANSVLLFLWLQQLTAATWRSLVVAALFGLHPLHVESVAWAAERKDVLSTLFLLLTLMSYTAYTWDTGKSDLSKTPEPATANSPPPPGPVQVRTWHERNYVLALVFFALGLMSKPMLVTLPFLLLLLDFWPLGRFQPFSAPWPALKMLVREKIPFLFLAAISSVVTLLVQEKGHATYLGLSLGARLTNAIAAYWVYLGKTFWPLHLAIFYPHPAAGVTGAHPVSAGLLASTALGLLLIGIAAWTLRRRAPWFMVGWFWFLGTLVPVIGIIQVGGQALADRYTYFPLIGLFICGVWAAAALAKRWPAAKRAVALAWPLVIIFCAILTNRQVKFWRNDFTVFAHALEVSPNNALAHYHLGIAYRDQGQTTNAMTEFQQALAADPSFPPPYPEIGALLEEQGRRQEAMALYEQGLKATPWSEQLHNVLATRLWAQGKQEEALTHYADAIHLDPDYADAHFNFGMALASRGQFAEAAAQFAAACRLRPQDREALGCLAESLMKAGRPTQAEERFRELTQLAPTNAVAHQNLGLLLVERGSLDQALAQFEQAVALNPNWPDALNALAWLLSTHPQIEMRKPVEAVTLAQRACELSGGKQSRYWGTLDIAYAAAGRFAEAVQAATKAQQLAAAEGQTNAAQAAGARIEEYKKRLAGP